MEITKLAIYNMEVSLGERDTPTSEFPVLMSMNIKRSLANRFKYWMLCKFFPFHIERWD